MDSISFWITMLVIVAAYAILRWRGTMQGPWWIVFMPIIVPVILGTIGLVLMAFNAYYEGVEAARQSLR